MKGLLASLLPAAALGAAIKRQEYTLDPRSTFGPIASLVVQETKAKGISADDALLNLLPRAKLFKVENSAGTVRPGSKRVRAKYGPYVLVGKGLPREPSRFTNSLDPSGQAYLDIINEGLCKNCTVLKGQTQLSFADGTEAGPHSGVYLHHIISRDLSKPSALPLSECGPSAAAAVQSLTKSEFLAQGDDGLSRSVLFTSTDGKYNSGYFLGENDMMMSQVDLVNQNKETKEIYLTYDLEYVDGFEGLDASATLLSADDKCTAVNGEHAHHGDGGNPGIQIDPKAVAITESDRRVLTHDGAIVNAFGHMHDGGSRMILLINDKEVCSAEAVYGKIPNSQFETMTSMTPCPVGIPFKKGDVMTMRSVYDLPKHPVREGGNHNALGMADVMGMFYLIFAVEGQQSHR